MFQLLRAGGIAALLLGASPNAFISTVAADEQSVLAAPRNSGETTVFKTAATAKSAVRSDASDTQLKWRVRRANEETSPTKVVRADGRNSDQSSRVERASAQESTASPILRAANDSVLAPGTNHSPASTSRSGPRASPPRRLSAPAARTARALQGNDDTELPRAKPGNVNSGDPLDQPAADATPANPKDDAAPKSGRRYTDDANKNPLDPNSTPAEDKKPAEDPLGEKPAENPADKPEKKPTEAPTDAPADKPKLETPDHPMTDPADMPKDKSADRPAEPMDEPIQPIPMAEKAPRDDLTGAELEEFCRREEERRNEMLLGKKSDDSSRIGEIDYCLAANDEMKKRRVVDISVDISPKRPTGADSPKCDRVWKDITGKTLFKGRPYDLNVITGDATFRTVEGQFRTLNLRDLSKVEQGQFLTLYKLPVECTLIPDRYDGRSWAPSTYTWKASGTCHKPLYFEDVQLERYGHTWGPILQPGASAVHFFGTLPILPYKMGLQPPSECVYTLGYYRPGNCAPYLLDPLPISARAAAYEAGAWVTGVVVIP